jgi:rubrerythrin
MTIEDAIKAAIQLEKKVHASYVMAASQAIHSTARSVFQILAVEELSHVTYLENRLAEWRKDGCLALEKLKTNLPSSERIRAYLAIQPSKTIGPLDGLQTDLHLLRQTLLVENETTAFYQKMVHDLPAEAQTLFFRFLDIEDEHLAVVQAEIDSVNHWGRWLDLKDLESSFVESMGQ